MVKYSREPLVPERSAKAYGGDLRSSFKNTYNVCQNIKGWKLEEAKQYLQQVIDKKRCIPFRRYRSGVGRTAQAKEFKCTQGRWPEKSCKIVLGLLKNAESNAEQGGNMDMESLVIQHIAVNRACKGRRRTYRAHGRINAYMSSPAHIELVLGEDGAEKVEKPKGDKPQKFTKVQMSRRRLVASN